MNEEQDTIVVYGIAVLAPRQKAQAEKHCFGDCGKISMAGVIHDEQTGGLFVCCHKECPHEEEVIKHYGTTHGFGQHHTVHLRILKED